MTRLDAIDRAILAHLSAEGRLPVLELAARVGLSPTPCARRVKRMEEAGVILGYGARIDRKALGLAVSVLISVRLSRSGPGRMTDFLRAVARFPEVVECLLVTGQNVDYILRAEVADVEALGRFIQDRLLALPSVAETSTMVILKQDLPTG